VQEAPAEEDSYWDDDEVRSLHVPSDLVGRHWSGAIDEETKRGRVDLLRVYDAAYVKKLEEERGPFAVSDYATLSVAAELWTLDKVLAEMRVPREAVIRIERVWLGRTAK
jgi:hypothetical protein